MAETKRVGHEPSSGLYYEVLGGASERRGAPILMIHGGGGSGAQFRSTLQGAPGWADQLAARGHEVWVTDWPGSGRSGNRQIAEIEYADVVAGYRRLLRDVIAEPVVVMPHSMGGSTTWQLIAHEPDLVAGVVAIAAAYPGNVPPKASVLSDDGTTIVVVFEETGVRFNVDRTRGYIYEDDYILNQGIHTSTRFPRELIGQLRAGIVPFAPRMLLQRVGQLPGLPAVETTSGFAGKRIRLIAGTEDPAHTLEIERATARQLADWGADARLIWLGDRGISGNGHFLFLEDNQAEILEIVAEQVDVVQGLDAAAGATPAPGEGAA
jgi:pimeloyl-ACP methyl ester carboxylesterase